MFNIDDFLNKFKNLTPPDNEVREKVIEIIKNEINITIDKKNISIRNNSIFIKTKPIIKNELFINKEKLLHELKKSFGSKTPNDIK